MVSPQARLPLKAHLEEQRYYGLRPEQVCVCV